MVCRAQFAGAAGRQENVNAEDKAETMKAKPLRIIVMAVLAIALIAFAVDRLVFQSGTTSPARAEARVAATSTASKNPAAAPAAPAAADGNDHAAEPATAAPWAERLTVLADTLEIDPDSMRDAFLLDDVWLAELQPPQGAAALDTPDSVRQFRATYRVSVIMLVGDGGSALVNGQVIRVGQDLGGFRLVSLTPTTATFERGTTRVELALPSAADATAP